VPKTESFGCSPLVKDFVDVLANAERVIEVFSRYDCSDFQVQVAHQAPEFVAVAHAGAVGGAPDPLSSLSFLFALCAAAVTKGAPRDGD
jgi:hypothetical protein